MTEKRSYTDILQQYFGYSEFRSGQSQVIEHILAGQDVLCVMPTGAGKSICYQVPALAMDGITLVISPLISLMQDQVMALVQLGIRAAYLNSTLTLAQYQEVLRRAKAGRYPIMYVAPERLMSDSFIQFAQSVPIAMVTVDEAHCISRWGQDFRPSYLEITRFIESLPRRPVISAFTATATEKVKDDILFQLRMQEPYRITTGFNRENLTFEVRTPANKNTDLLRLVKDRHDLSGIVYCLTRSNVESVCEFLELKGYSATRYHAGLSDQERKQNQEDFLHDRKRVMVATNAFGMGIDKSNVSYVIHYNMPMNVESYYQEAGRAGRDGNEADCILLYSGADVRLNQFLIDKSAERYTENTEVSDNPPSPQDLQQRLLHEKELLKKMTFYATGVGCLRHYILQYFGESAPLYCGKCSTCNQTFVSTDVTAIVRGITACLSSFESSGQSYGKKMLCDILRGSSNEKLQQRQLQHSSSYGILSNTPEPTLRDVLENLIQSGTVLLSDGQYPTLSLAKSTTSTPSEDERIFMRLPERIPQKSSQKASRTATQSPLFTELKALRHKLAEEAHVPAYTIFSDVSLLDMCKILPTDPQMFLRVTGVGTIKRDRYGAAFMEIIRKYQGKEIGMTD